MKALVYDIEIEKAVPVKHEAQEPGVEYCDGWSDHAGMGVATVAALQTWDMRPRMFYADNREAFLEARDQAELLVSFNGIRFDEPVLAASGWLPEDYPRYSREHHYDILRELWIAKGFDPDRFEESHRGHGLDACARKNGLGAKTGHGGTAPIDFQRGRHGTLCDYNLADVWLTWRLFDRILRNGFILDPIDGRSAVSMRSPEDAP